MRSLFLALLILISQCSFAQWRRGHAISNVLSLDFISKDLILAVKADSIAFGKPDDADSWEIVPLQLDGKKILNNSMYYWDQTTPVDFIHKDLGYACVKDSAGRRNIVKITNLGTSYETVSMPSIADTEEVMDLKFFNAEEGILVCWRHAFVTHDGGHTWEEVTLPNGVRGSGPYSYPDTLRPVQLHLYPDGKGSIIGRNGIMITRDFGKTWKSFLDMDLLVDGRLSYLVIYDVLLKDESVYLFGSESAYMLNINDCFKLDESTGELTRFYTKGRTNVFRDTWNHGVFFSEEEIHMVNYTEAYGQETKQGIFKIIDTLATLAFPFNSDKLRYYYGRLPYSYTPDHSMHVFIDNEQHLMVYNREVCDKIVVKGFEFKEDYLPYFSIKIDNQMGRELSYPGSLISVVKDGVLQPVAESQTYWAATGPDSKIQSMLLNHPLDTNAVHYVLLWENSFHCNYVYDPAKFISSGIGEKVNSDHVVIYPNPVLDSFSIQGVNAKEIKLTDSKGKVVLDISVTNQEAFDVRDLEPGIYYLSITDHSGETIGKTIFIE